jgi:hypothetical protein
MTDTAENLNRNTAWQYLLTVIAIAEHAADNPLDELRKPAQDAVYFPFLPGVLILMTAWVSNVLCAVICVLALVFIIWQAKRKQLKVSFPLVLMGLLLLLSLGSAIWFAAGSYLFYIPLFVMVAKALLRKWTPAHTIARFAGGVAVLLLWVPVVFLLWVSMIQPMML